MISFLVNECLRINPEILNLGYCLRAKLFRLNDGKTFWFIGQIGFNCLVVSYFGILYCIYRCSKLARNQEQFWALHDPKQIASTTHHIKLLSHSRNMNHNLILILHNTITVMTRICCKSQSGSEIPEFGDSLRYLSRMPRDLTWKGSVKMITCNVGVSTLWRQTSLDLHNIFFR